MQRYAGLEPIIAVLVGVGWFIVKAIMNRREEADSWDESTAPPAPRPHIPQQNRGTPPAVVQKPGPRSTPPVQRPPILILPPRPAKASQPTTIYSSNTVPPPPAIAIPAERAQLKDSEESYKRASNLQESIAARFAAVDRQTMTHTAAATVQHQRDSDATAGLRDAFRHPPTIRQAFLASFVLSPPKSLE